MGERSQIFIKTNYTDKNGETTNKLYAFYYQWNYNERMISRMESLTEWLKENASYIYMPDIQKKLGLIAQVNFDMKDVLLTSDIIKEQFECNDYKMISNVEIFDCNDNNHGQGFIELDYNDRTKESQIYYCFRQQGKTFPMSAEEYLMWDNELDLDIEGLEEHDARICDSLPERLYYNLTRILSIRSLEDMKDIIPALCDNIKFLNEECKIMTKERLMNFLSFDYSKQFQTAQKNAILDNLSYYERLEREQPNKFTDRVEEAKGYWEAYQNGTLDRDEKEEEIDR